MAHLLFSPNKTVFISVWRFPSSLRSETNIFQSSIQPVYVPETPRRIFIASMIHPPPALNRAFYVLDALAANVGGISAIFAVTDNSKALF
jgi:hypothetical protein